MNTAAAIILKRARETDEFKAGYARALLIARMRHIGALEAVADAGGDEAAYMTYIKARGGWTQIATDAFTAEVGDASIPGSFGSSFPIASAFDRSDAIEIRNRAMVPLEAPGVVEVPA